MKTNTIYSISGLSCNHCVAKVRTTLAPYADTVEVTLKPPQIILTGQTANIETMNAVLDAVGNYRIGAEVA
jgi:copper chaperone CopZ